MLSDVVMEEFLRENTTRDLGPQDSFVAQSRLSEIWVQAILGSMTEGLIIIDLQGRIIGVNPAAVRMFGFEDPSEVYMRPIREVAELFEINHLDGTPLSRDEYALARVMRGERFSSQEELLRRRDTGHALIASYCGTPVCDKAGHVVMAVLTIRDLTIEKQALAEHERLLATLNRDLERRVSEMETLLDLIPVGIAISYDAECKHIRCNPAYARLLGITPDTNASLSAQAPDGASKHRIFKDGRELSAQELPLQVAAAQGLEVRDLEIDVLRIDGRKLALLVNAVPLFDESGRSRGCVATLVDITTGRRAQEALRLAHEQLERRVRERTMDLEVANNTLRSEIERRTEAEAQQKQAQKALQVLSSRLVEVQENERRAIARELHDEAGQALTSLLLGLGMLERECDHADAVAERARELKLITDEIMDGLHRLAVNLRPVSLDRSGLVPALEQYVSAFEKQTGLKIEIGSIGVSGDRLPSEIETTVYRICQEALTNITRHAQASQVGIVIDCRGGRLLAIIEDDGIGFDVAEATQRGRLGLLGMHERAELVRGTVTIESTIGGGTTVYVEVPLPQLNVDTG